MAERDLSIAFGRLRGVDVTWFTAATSPKPGQKKPHRGIVNGMIAFLDPMLCVRRHVDLLRVRTAICRNVG